MNDQLDKLADILHAIKLADGETCPQLRQAIYGVAADYSRQLAEMLTLAAAIENFCLTLPGDD